jgi:hypothetical protein
MKFTERITKMQRRFHQNGESRLIANAPRPTHKDGFLIGRGWIGVQSPKQDNLILRESGSDA